MRSREVEPARHFNSFAQGATISGPLWRKGIFASASHPYLIAMPRRFSPPWEIDDNGACFMGEGCERLRREGNVIWITAAPDDPLATTEPEMTIPGKLPWSTPTVTE